MEAIITILTLTCFACAFIESWEDARARKRYECWINSDEYKEQTRRLKRSYRPEEVKRVLHSPVFTKGHRPKAGKGDAAFWLPLLLLFTGARLEELCHLTVDHIRTSEGMQRR